MPLTPRDLRWLALGTVIMVWRERIRDLNQTELEDRAKLPRGSVSKFERGQATPSAEELETIARVFRVEVAELLRGASLLLDHLVRGLGPLGVDGEGSAFVPSSEIAEGGTGMPEELRRRWEGLVSAERKLALDRSLLEYETVVHAGRLALGQGPPA